MNKGDLFVTILSMNMFNEMRLFEDEDQVICNHGGDWWTCRSTPAKELEVDGRIISSSESPYSLELAGRSCSGQIAPITKIECD